MSKLYLEIFDSTRSKIFKQLAPMAKYGVLAGGTSLALQLGHRKSFDFDIFVPKPISSSLFKMLEKSLNYSIVNIRIKTSDIIQLKTIDGVEIHVVYVWYKRISETIKTSSLDLESVADIAANKANTIGRRGQWRDYVDLFFLLKNNLYGLQEIIDLAQKKYSIEFNPRLFLEQLCYFEDIHDFGITFLKKAYSVTEVKKFLINEVRNYHLL